MSKWISPNKYKRYQAFFKREHQNVPLIGCILGFYMHQRFPRTTATLPNRRLTPDDINVDAFLEDSENLYQAYQKLDDDFGFVGAPFISIPWMEAIMGCPLYTQETSIYAQPCVEDLTQWHYSPDEALNNHWTQKLLELTEALVQHSGGRYPVAPTLMRGPSDILSAIRGGPVFPLDFYDSPGAVKGVLRLISDIWIEIGKAQLSLIPPSPKGHIAGGHGLKAWAPDKLIWLQEDAMALLSPTFFKQFILPEDQRILAEFKYSAFHLHNTGMWAIDDLVKINELDIIELNAESALTDDEATFSSWHKIKQHKPLVIWKEFKEPDFWPWFTRVLQEFSPEGLSIQYTVKDLEEGLYVRSRIRETIGQ